MPRIRNKKRSDGRLQAKVYLGLADGKAKYKYVYASTQKELESKVRDIKVALGKGLDVTQNNDKFSYWRQQWLKLKKNTVSAQRYNSYSSISKKLEPLDNSTVTRLTVADIQNIIFDNSELSPTTLAMIKSAAKQIFQLAIDSRIMDYNPAVNVRTCPHRKFRTSFRQILPIAALKKLTIRQYAFAFSPCTRQNYARKSAHNFYVDRF